MADIIQFRRGTAARWASVNPVLALGELGYEKDTGLAKVGDGVSAWNALPYFFQGTGGTPFGDNVEYDPAGADGDGSLISGLKYDTGEREAVAEFFGTNPPGGRVPLHALQARNGALFDIIYGYCNGFLGGGDVGLKIRLVGDRDNPEVITELSFERNTTVLGSKGDVILSSWQSLMLIANSQAPANSQVYLAQDGSILMRDGNGNYLLLKEDGVVLSSTGGYKTMEITSGATLTVSAATDMLLATQVGSIRLCPKQDLTLLPDQGNLYLGSSNGRVVFLGHYGRYTQGDIDNAYNRGNVGSLRIRSLAEMDLTGYVIKIASQGGITRGNEQVIWSDTPPNLWIKLSIDNDSTVSDVLAASVTGTPWGVLSQVTPGLFVGIISGDGVDILGYNLSNFVAGADGGGAKHGFILPVFSDEAREAIVEPLCGEVVQDEQGVPYVYQNDGWTRLGGGGNTVDGDFFATYYGGPGDSLVRTGIVIINGAADMCRMTLPPAHPGMTVDVYVPTNSCEWGIWPSPGEDVGYGTDVFWQGRDGMGGTYTNAVRCVATATGVWKIIVTK